MKMRSILAAGLLLAAMPPAAMGMWADVPLEVVVQRCELVVVAEVTTAGAVAHMQLKIPGAKQPVGRLYRNYTLQVKQVLRENGAAPKDETPKDRKIEVLAEARPPAGPGVPVVSDDMSVSLRVGQSYVLALRKLPDRVEYYLSAYPRNRASASAERIDLYKKAAQLEDWPWGKAVDGLQIALLHATTKLRIRTVAVRRPGGPPRGVPQQSVYLQPVVVLRNTTKEPIAVSLWPGERFLNIWATGAGGKTVTLDLYSRLAVKLIAEFGPVFVRKIEPGKILFINAFGEVTGASAHNVPLSPGAWKLHAGYTAIRKSVGSANAKAAAQKLWTGKVESVPVEIEVQPAQGAPGAAAGGGAVRRAGGT
ncbi:MAG TPA: hypothetical protein VNA25_15945 [Phycisphaerae bacterium]|nr:hypothetical protein [Phycisphaerae bacterium]HUT59341.1 hypothetical protein [Phycisphaerae bacterium]